VLPKETELVASDYRRVESKALAIGASYSKTASKFGTKVDEIFVSYEELKAKLARTSRSSPWARWASTPPRRRSAPACSRNFNLSTITRRDLMSLSEECEKVTGIPYVMRAYRKEAEKILAQ